MTQVDFYILQKQKASGIFFFACRLLEKIYKKSHKAMVHVNSEAEANSFDQLLWTYNDSSFVPHALSHEAQANDAPIVITCKKLDALDASDTTTQDIYINLTHEVTQHIQNFARVIEVVPNEEPWLSHSRQKFVKYQEFNCELQTHKIAS